MTLTTRRLAAAILFVGLFAMSSRAAVDSDVFWHLRAGAWMAEHGRTLTQDVFSHTVFGQRWEYPAWLTELILYGLYSRWGFGALTLFTAVCVTVAFVFVYFSCRGGVYLKAGIIILAATTSAVFWAARPHIVTFAFSAVTLYVLRLFWERDRNYLWTLPLLMILWGNMHPGFAVGFILIGLVLVSETIKAGIAHNRAAWRKPVWLAVTALVCAAALLISPYGISQWAFPFKTVSSSLLQDYIQEWQSPNFHLREVQVFIVLSVVLFGAVGLSRKQIDLTDLVLVGACFYLALVAGRNIAIFSLVAAPVIARHVEAIASDYAQRHSLVLLDARPSSSPPRYSVILNWALLAVVVFAASLKVALPLDPALNARLAAAALPVRAAQFVAASKPTGPMFNPYNWGGFLSWALYPDYLIYVDGRTDLYGDEFFAEYLRVASGAPDWEQVLERRGVNLLILEAGSPMAALAGRDPDWGVRYADPLAVVLIRIDR